MESLHNTKCLNNVQSKKQVYGERFSMKDQTFFCNQLNEFSPSKYMDINIRIL